MSLKDDCRLTSMSDYQPPYRITSRTLSLVAEIVEAVGRYGSLIGERSTHQLRRETSIKTIQASLAIENNTLSLEQVTAVIDGRRVAGDPREILEVRNAFTAYQTLPQWFPSSANDLLQAHELMMSGLIDDPGLYRSGGVGVFHGSRLIHMAPPASLIPQLIANLLNWLSRTSEHPLVASCVFHYEFEFIHPFSDGNGRLGRLWQTLILQRWRPLFACVPVETLIRYRQADYYHALEISDQQADSTPFVEFMLSVLHDSVAQTIARQTEEQSTDQVTDQVTGQVTGQAGGQVRGRIMLLVQALGDREMSASELMEALGLSHRASFRENYLNPALRVGLIERTQPDSPRSPAQRYHLTSHGPIQLDDLA